MRTASVRAWQVAARRSLGHLVLASGPAAGQQFVSMTCQPGRLSGCSSSGVLNLVLGAVNSCPVLPPRWRLENRPRPGSGNSTGSSAVAFRMAAGIGRFLSLMAIGMGTLIRAACGGLRRFWLILLGLVRACGARATNSSSLAGGGDARTQSGRRAPVAFGCWNLMLPAGPQPAAPQRRFLPAADWVLICDRGVGRGVIDDQACSRCPCRLERRERVVIIIAVR